MTENDLVGVRACYLQKCFAKMKPRGVSEFVRLVANPLIRTPILMVDSTRTRALVIINTRLSPHFNCGRGQKMAAFAQDNA